MQSTIIGIPHAQKQLATYFSAKDWERLNRAAEVHVLGSNKLDTIREELAEVEILCGSWGMPKLDDALLAAAPRLKAVCYAAGTVKGFVTPASYARGVRITTAMHANAIPVAEVTTALITLCNKNWFNAIDRLRAEGRSAWRSKNEAPHPGNYDSTVGLIGFGAIGREVAKRLQGLELEVLVYDPYAPAEELAAYGCTRVDELHELARRAWIVSLHAPNIDACAGMCDAAFFAAMQEGATFINTARGRIVVEADLIAALESGRINAHLDVTFPDEPPKDDSPLYRLPNCWLTPHRAGSSSHEIRRMGAYAVDECLRHIAGEPFRHEVTEEMLATMA